MSVVLFVTVETRGRRAAERFLIRVTGHATDAGVRTQQFEVGMLVGECFGDEAGNIVVAPLMVRVAVATHTQGQMCLKVSVFDERENVRLSWGIMRR